jgi:hypothetical protein
MQRLVLLLLQIHQRSFPAIKQTQRPSSPKTKPRFHMPRLCVVNVRCVQSALKARYLARNHVAFGVESYLKMARLFKLSEVLADLG